MADSYAFDLESTRRIVRAVRTVEASPRGYLGPPRQRTGDIGRDPVMLLNVTSATPTGNLYPAEVQVYGSSAGTTANLCACWAFDPSGTALTVGYYVGRALHLNTDGAIIYGVEGKTPPSGSTLTSPALTTPTITSPTIAGDLIFSEGSSSTISSNTNNYAPSTWGPVLPLNVTSVSNLTGLVPPATVSSSTVLQTTLFNTGTSTLTIISTSSSSTSTNQFSVPGGGNVVVNPGGALTVVYNPATSKWVPVGSSSSYLLQTYPVATTAPTDGQSLFYSVSTGQYAPGILPTAGGGTGLTTPSTYQLLAGPATSGGALQQISGVGTSGQVLTSNGASSLPTWQTVSSGGSGTVTSVAAAGPTGLFSWSSAVTTTGTLTATLSNQSANQVFAGPSSGGATTPTFRALAAADIPSLPASQITSGQLAVARGGTGLDGSSAANGKLLIGNGSGFTLATLTAGSNVTITNAAGSITIASSGGGGGSPMLVSGISGMVTLVGVVSYTISGTTYYSPLYNGFSTSG